MSRPAFTPGRPTSMREVIWDRVSALPSHPTARHPMGQRYAVLERASFLIYEAGLDPSVADERALAEEAGVHIQQNLGGV